MSRATLTWFNCLPWFTQPGSTRLVLIICPSTYWSFVLSSPIERTQILNNNGWPALPCQPPSHQWFQELGMATITNPLSSLDHSGHPQLPVCARRQGGQAEDAHHGQVRRHQLSTFHHLQVTSDHNHHNHWRTNWRTAKYGVTNLAPLPTDQMPIISDHQ